jgi:hypothetical protein
LDATSKYGYNAKLVERILKDICTRRVQNDNRKKNKEARANGVIVTKGRPKKERRVEEPQTTHIPIAEITDEEQSAHESDAGKGIVGPLEEEVSPRAQARAARKELLSRLQLRNESQQ